ncbi:MAG: methylated-DNA--[protein]-cysteine S-methyltransferase [Burkholderiales bacterium]|nr:methylated-DNA--[protein]-cysteine S-methyltransferase [Burkholderiales bacterium]MDE2456445.1 methylated-DNA--[protein]-cysteine S-methyltransferase [Burkholderiales bacterium]
MKNPRISAQARIDTPLGPLLLAATPAGLAGAWFDGQRHHPGPIEAPTDPHQAHIAQAARELAEYFAARRQRFDVALDAEGTPFQHAVWSALCRIAPGATASYGEVARGIERAAALRAVGAAVGRNPVSVIVPCHRVLGGDGSLTGYAGGLERKRALLELEAGVAR